MFNWSNSVLRIEILRDVAHVHIVIVFSFILGLKHGKKVCEHKEGFLKCVIDQLKEHRRLHGYNIAFNKRISLCFNPILKKISLKWCKILQFINSQHYNIRIYLVKMQNSWCYNDINSISIRTEPGTWWQHKNILTYILTYLVVFSIWCGSNTLNKKQTFSNPLNLQLISLNTGVTLTNTRPCFSVQPIRFEALLLQLILNYWAGPSSSSVECWLVQLWNRRSSSNTSSSPLFSMVSNGPVKLFMTVEQPLEV